MAIFAATVLSPKTTCLLTTPRLFLLRCRPISAATSANAPPPPTFDLRSYWSQLITQIDAELSSAVPLRYPQSIHESMRYSVLAPGAKRAPPILCIATACDLLGAPPSAAFPTAAALEMAHTASLVHDDLPCMDSSPFRRGRPSNHSIFGAASAVLAGDALFPLGFHHILERTPRHLVPDSVLVSVVAEIARAVGSTGMASGQYLDLAGCVPPSDVMAVLEKKFGEMAECSATCGGLIGGAHREVLDGLRRYGRAVGVLYQVVDDVLMEGEDRGGGKLKSNASVVKVFGMDRAMEIVEELREKAMREVQRLEEKYGVERVTPLRSFVDYAVERGFEVKGTESGGDGWRV